jgi:hypothetical protein
LRQLDGDYSKIRDAIKAKYPEKDFTYMLDYLALERLSNQSENTDVRESFTTSLTLGAIKPPTVQQENGEWAIDTNHRFFNDDIQYGLCIAKWMAEQLSLAVPTIDRILEWVQELRREKIIDNGKLQLESKSLATEYMSGIPPVYGLNTIDEIVD